jgi:hypothetical protein
MSPHCITSISLMVIIFLLIFPIGGLLAFHIVLVSKGRTTNEHVTGKYKGMDFFTRGCCTNFDYLFCSSLIPRYKSVRLKVRVAKKRGADSGKKSSLNENDIEIGPIEKKSNRNTEESQRASLSSDNECNSTTQKDKQRLTVSFSGNNANSNNANGLSNNLMSNNSNSQEQELLDVVLKNKKLFKNNRKSSITSDSSISSSMLNKSSKMNQLNNNSFDTNRISIKA